MNKTFKQLDFVIQKTEELMGYYHQTSGNEISLFALCMLDRLNLTSEGIKVLLNKFTANTKVEYSCGLVLRTFILDYLIVLNANQILLTNIDDSSNSELKTFCMETLCDSVNWTVEDFESMRNELSLEEITVMYTNLVNSNIECFEPYNYDGNKPVVKHSKSYNARKLYNKISNSKYFGNQSEVYSAYQFYSRYEHFGLIHNRLSRESVTKQLEYIAKVIRVFPKCLFYLIIILQHLQQNDSFLTQKRNEVFNFDNTIK